MTTTCGKKQNISNFLLDFFLDKTNILSNIPYILSKDMLKAQYAPNLSKQKKGKSETL
jgi:hypothetical protein